MVLIWFGQRTEWECCCGKKRALKFGKVYEGFDKESIKEKYAKIDKKFVSNLPPAVDKQSPLPENFF